MPERITQPVPRFREYEIIYILRSDVDSEAAEKVATRVSEVMTRENGKLLKVETGAVASWPTRSRSSAVVLLHVREVLGQRPDGERARAKPALAGLGHSLPDRVDPF